VFVITFQPGTDVSGVLQIKKVCHCIVQWEKCKSTKRVFHCCNCQSFGHSSIFCGKPPTPHPRCVKCDQPHANRECQKPNGKPPKCVNCGGAHPANFTDCLSYQQQHQQLSFLRQCQLRVTKPTTHAFQFQQAHFGALKAPITTPTAHNLDSNRVSASDYNWSAVSQYNWSAVSQLFVWHRKILSLKV